VGRGVGTTPGSGTGTGGTGNGGTGNGGNNNIISYYTVQGNRLIDKSTNSEVILYGVHISRPEIFDPSKTLAFNNWRDGFNFI